MKRTFAPLALTVAAAAHSQTAPKQDLTGLSIEDLLKIEVITANRAGQSMMRAPAAVFVLTGDDIRRSGATTLPEMLRGIPGVNVARINGNKWMVSMRGFNGRFANKLQVLIDGLSIYHPLFSGVFWDDFRLSADEIERIEVVRGPFGATWGANSVNGVINIITKHASQTQGGWLEASGGDVQTAGHRLRYGTSLGQGSYLRVSGGMERFADLETSSGSSGHDGWRANNLSFRLDRERGNESLRVNGYWSGTQIHESGVVPILEEPYVEDLQTTSRNRVGFLNVAWTRNDVPGHLTTVRASYNDSDREDFELPNHRKTLDIEWRQDRQHSADRTTSWGASYRSSTEKVLSTEWIQMTPQRRREELFGAFLHHENSLGGGLRVYSDAMLEHNDYSGWEFQPSLAVTYARNDRETFWTAISRSVRSPSRSEADSSIWAQAFLSELLIPGKARLVGDREFKAETVVAFEIGWRHLTSTRTSLDVTGFVNLYDNLRTFELQEPGMGTEPVPHIDQPAIFSNKLNAVTSGIEAVARFNPQPGWKLTLGYSLFHDDFFYDRGSADAFELVSTEREGSTPRHSASVRSSHDLRGGFTFDLMASYTDRVLATETGPGTQLNMRLGWSPCADFELSLTGTNLLNRRRREGGDSLFESVSAVPRGYSISAAWRF